MQTQTQTRRAEPPAFQEWYVVADDGASAFRVTPGLTVGESDSGTLALNDPGVGNQWVELVLAANGEPWATIITRDKSLRVAGTTCLRYQLQAGAAIQLPNNTLHISRDIRAPRPSGTVVEVVHREIPQPLQDLVAPQWEESSTAAPEPRPASPTAETPESSDPAEAEPNLGAWGDWPDRAEPREHARGPQPGARRHQVSVLAAVLALGAVTLAGLVAMLVSMSGSEISRVDTFDVADAPSVRPPAETPARVESPDDAVPVADDPIRAATEVAKRGSGAELPPSAAGSDMPDRADALPDEGPAQARGPAPAGEAQTAGTSAPPAAEAVAPEPAATADQGPEQQTSLPRAEPEPPQPVVLPPVERRSPPEVAQTTAASETAADPQPTEREPDAALVAELEEIGLAARGLSTELTRRRDLLAADLALAQGRLTAPPEASAYTLYNRVLAVDPGSAEAASGLQSVRQQLINRALAQLAGNDLDAARQTLQAAAVAGADPQLVADLRGEVDFRQQSNDAGSQTSTNSLR